MLKRRLFTLIATLIMVLCLVMSVSGETFVIKESGLILEAVSVVPLGGRVLSGNTAGVSGVGTFALYYTGYDRERNVIRMRSKWAFGGAALTNPAVMGQGEQELTISLRANESTRVLLSPMSAKGWSDNTPTVELLLLGVDELQQLQLERPSNIVLKGDKK